MKLPQLTDNQKTALGLLGGVLFIAPGGWQMEQQNRIIFGGSHIPTKLQPVPISLKCTVFYVSESQASTYRQSQDLSYFFFAVFFLIVLIHLAGKHFSLWSTNE